MKADGPRAASWMLCAVLVLSVAACEDEGPTLTIPDGTPVTVSLYATTRSDRVDPGARLLARVEQTVSVQGRVVLDPGDLVALEVLDARAGDGDHPPRLRLRLVTLEFPHGRTELEARPIEFVGRRTGADATPPTDEEPQESGDADRVLLPVKGNALVLLAGQHMRFVTSRPIEVAISP